MSIIEVEPGDPKLTSQSIDVVITVLTYHEIQWPLVMLAKLAPAVVPGGRLVIEEPDRPTQAHGIPPELVTCEFASAGYRQIELKPLKGDIH